MSDKGGDSNLKFTYRFMFVMFFAEACSTDKRGVPTKYLQCRLCIGSLVAVF